jgi:amino acid adenylation domain-containing protein
MIRTAGSAEERLDAVSKGKKELLKLLLEEKARQTQKISPCPRGDVIGSARVPTSSAQQRMWFIDQLEEGSSGYQVPVAVRLLGDLDKPALRNALDTLVRRHEVLRTVFVSCEGEPRQEIAPKGHFSLTEIDLRCYEAAEREAQVRHQAAGETHGKFDLSVGPLVRGRLLRLRDQEHVLLMTMHHIISDGWSKGVLIREVAELYTAYTEGRDDPLEPLPIQYADYAQWQRQRLRGEPLQKQVSYWCTRLAGAAPHLDLPTDWPRPAVQSHRGENVRILLDAQLSNRLKSFAQQHRMTLFMVLYAAWAILLSRLSGQEDVSVGMPIANRQRPELESLIGLFVNTLVLRVAVRGDASLAEFLEQVKGVTLGAYDHQDAPFEKVVEALQPERSLSRNPLFQVGFVLQNAPRSDLALPGLRVTVEDIADEPAIFDLTLLLEERGDEISGIVNYARELFDRQTVERWMAGFTTLLKGMSDGAHDRIEDLPIVPERERHQVLGLFNLTEVDYPHDRLIYELFEQQVRRTPDATAVEYDEQSLTYSQLNQRANQLARYLRDKGVDSDQLVGVCIERSLEMVVGLLGILKAGGAYVPLDPNYPAERLKYMLEDAAPAVVLTQAALKTKMPCAGAVWVALDSEWKAIARYASENLSGAELELSSQSRVYVIYTSGSTGRPKGTEMTNRSMVNLIEWHRRVFAGSEGRRVLQFAALSFDVAFQETFSTLCTGGTLVLLDEWVRRDARALAELLSIQSIQRLFVPPLMLQGLAESFMSMREAPECLQDVITAGEQLRVTPEITALFRRIRGCRLHNHYGPTESHVVTALTLTDDPEQWPLLPAIGKPISNTQIYVLDAQRQPVPIGVAGEIYIGGANVARGYLKRPELTAQRFVADSFSTEAGARLYRTGDIGRWRADGTLEYLGRNDDQVKVRGYRIELGEIEAQLARHAQVREAAVVVRQDVAGEKRLVAYITLRDEVTVSVEELRAHLRAVLADHMVPGAFVTLQRLPLTPSGKLDRRALPAPELEAYVSRRYEAPEGEVEATLATIWQELLRVERVGRQDNFFELGGHSLLIVKMKERLRQAGLSAAVRSVYESPTLAALASTLTGESMEDLQEVPPNLIPSGCEVITPQMLPLVKLDAQHIQQIVQAVPGGAANIQDIYPLAPLQEGVLFHYLLNEHGGDVYVVTTLLSLPSRECLDNFVRALQQVIDRHDIPRTAVLWEGLPRPVQVVYRRAILPVDEVILDPDRDPIEQQKERMRPERQRLDLRRAPLMRLQIAADEQRSQWYALLQFHHLTHDHDSMETMFGEVMACLEGRAAELPAPLPYRDHVAQALAQARADDAEGFFRAKLADIDEPTAPFGLLDVHGDGSRIELASHMLEPALAQRLDREARRLGVSAATLFHAAWALVVARTSGRDDVVFGTLLSGRLQGSAGAQPTLGMFINTLPLRLKLQHVTPRELVEQTQRELIDLLSHEQASLAAAKRCAGTVGSAPLFTALLNYRHSTTDYGSQFSGAGIGILDIKAMTNYPVTFGVLERNGAFLLDMEADRRIDPHRMMQYVCTAIQSLIEALEQASQTPALTLAVLPESEREQILRVFNRTQVAYSGEKLIHELFEEQVDRSPDALAVICGQDSMTYAELNSRADQLAQFLRGRGIDADELVGICVERSLEMVVGLLGILKAGGAYVPLDPGYPAERLKYVLEDAVPRVVLTQESLRSSLSRMAVEVIALDKDWGEITRFVRESPELPSRATSRHLAYVIYTSGSTGNPKGVMIEQTGAVNFLCSMRRDLEISATDTLLGVTTISFDIAALEIYLPLISGAKLVLASREAASDGHLLMKMLEEHEITFLQATPATWQLLLSGGWSGRARLNALCGGEALTTDLSGKLVNRTGALWNLYGPTETTIWSCIRRITAAEAQSAVEPIGQPIENTQVYILDRQLQPVPLGVTGEIYIGGAGVARGYLNRPQLTAERFIRDPFSADAHGRLYKTGDLGRWRSDGTIEYLGRNDHQVKIRGHRIELGEIEAQLAQHKEVTAAAVVAREDIPGERRLVAYVTRPDKSRTGVEELRSHLKAVLPEYMVPGTFVLLESLPLTPNGKLDRRALPAPGAGDDASRHHRAPEGEVEEMIAGIWRQILHVERVGRHDNFFELGGHSLLGMKLITEIANRFRVRLPVIAAFRYPTIQELAKVVESLRSDESEELSSDGMELEEGVI